MTIQSVLQMLGRFILVDIVVVPVVTAGLAAAIYVVNWLYEDSQWNRIKREWESGNLGASED